MRNSVSTFLAIAFSLSLSASGAQPDPERWYVDEYASLWVGEPGKHVEAMLMHYAEEVRTHNEGGGIAVTPRRKWLVEPMQGWLADGWVDSELKAVVTDRINATTASFKAIWTDHYSNAPDDFSCGWYLADFIDDRWQFTAYADIDCDAHGLN